MPRVAAGGRRWYRSLYWRIALGLVVTIAAIIAVQGLVVLWLLGRDGPAPGPPPPGFARLVAQDLGRELAATPGLDLERFVREEYQQRLFPFAVVLRDGRVVSHDGATVPDELREVARLTARPRRRGVPASRQRGALADAADAAGRGFGRAGAAARRVAAGGDPRRGPAGGRRAGDAANAGPRGSGRRCSSPAAWPCWPARC